MIFGHDPLSQLAIDLSSHMKLMHTRTDSPRFDSDLEIKVNVKSSLLAEVLFLVFADGRKETSAMGRKWLH